VEDAVFETEDDTERRVAEREGAVRIASKTGRTSVAEPEMTRRMSLVAVCCSSASVSRFVAAARRFSRS